VSREVITAGGVLAEIHFGRCIVYRLSAIGYRLSAIGYRLSAIAYRLSLIGYRLCLTGRSTADTRGTRSGA